MAVNPIVIHQMHKQLTTETMSFPFHSALGIRLLREHGNELPSPKQHEHEIIGPSTELLRLR